MRGQPRHDVQATALGGRQASCFLVTPRRIPFGDISLPMDVQRRRTTRTGIVGSLLAPQSLRSSESMVPRDRTSAAKDGQGYHGRAVLQSL